MSLQLTNEERIEITGYVRQADQLRYFKALGVPAHRRPDGTVSVCRQHYLDLRRLADNAPAPDRPKLRSDEKAAQAGLRKARLALVR